MKIFLAGEFSKLDKQAILRSTAWVLIDRARTEGIPLTVNEARAMFPGNVPPHPDSSRGGADVSAVNVDQAGDSTATPDTTSTDPSIKKGK